MKNRLVGVYEVKGSPRSRNNGLYDANGESLSASFGKMLTLQNCVWYYNVFREFQLSYNSGIVLNDGLPLIIFRNPKEGFPTRVWA